MAETNPEEEQEEEPEYMKNPIVNKYVGFMHQIIDSLYATTPEPQVEEVELLKDVLMTVHTVILFDGGLAELNDILRMHYPSNYDKPNESSIDALISYPLSGLN